MGLPDQNFEPVGEVKESVGLVQLDQEGHVNWEALGMEGVLLHHQRAHLIGRWTTNNNEIFYNRSGSELKLFNITFLKKIKN